MSYVSLSGSVEHHSIEVPYVAMFFFDTIKIEHAPHIAGTATFNRGRLKWLFLKES